MSRFPEAGFERMRDGYVISDDPARIDRDAVHRFLAEEAYWARGVSRAVLDRALDHSLCLGIRAPDGGFAAFGRLVTDGAMFAYLRDVFVLPAHRGRGLSVWLATVMREHSALAGVENWMLATRDAHDVYARAGFRPVPHPEFYMSLPRAPADEP